MKKQVPPLRASRYGRDDKFVVGGRKSGSLRFGRGDKAKSRSLGCAPFGRFGRDDKDWVLPAAGVVMLEVVGGGKGDDPEANDEGADGEDPLADGTVVGSEASGFADAEGLAGESDEHEEDADGEGDPCHGHGIPFYPNRYRCGKREMSRAGGSLSQRAGLRTQVRDGKGLSRGFGAR